MSKKARYSTQDTEMSTTTVTSTKRGAGRYRKRASKTNFKNYANLGKGFPKKLVETHKYAELVNLATGAAGAQASYTFSCNGLYDPNITGTGHQPMYFDQLSAIYDHYCCVASKISVRFCPQTTTVPCLVAVYVNDDSTVTPNIQGAIEQSTGVTALLGPNTDLTKQLKLSWNAKSYFGKDPLSNTELQGTASANPTEQSFYTITIDSAAQAIATTVVVLVEIEYTAVWKEVKDLTSS